MPSGRFFEILSDFWINTFLKYLSPQYIIKTKIVFIIYTPHHASLLRFAHARCHRLALQAKHREEALTNSLCLLA